MWTRRRKRGPRSAVGGSPARAHGYCNTLIRRMALLNATIASARAVAGRSDMHEGYGSSRHVRFESMGMEGRSNALVPRSNGNRSFGTSIKAPPAMVDGVGPFARTCMRSRTHTRVVCPLMRSIALGRCGMKVAKQIIWQSLIYGADGSGWRVDRVMRAQAHGRLQSSALRCARDVRREGAGGLGIVVADKPPLSGGRMPPFPRPTSRAALG